MYQKQQVCRVLGIGANVYRERPKKLAEMAARRLQHRLRSEGTKLKSTFGTGVEFNTGYKVSVGYIARVTLQPTFQNAFGSTRLCLWQPVQSALAARVRENPGETLHDPLMRTEMLAPATFF